MTESTELPPKPEVALALLQTALSVYVHLDPRPDDVHVPSWLKKQPQLVLQVGMNMAVAIPDLDVGQDALSCTLSFNRRPEFCRIPWTAIYGLVGDDGRGMIWPDSIPPEVAAAAEGRAAGAKKDAPKKETKRRLRAVTADDAGSTDAGSSDESVSADDGVADAAADDSTARTGEAAGEAAIATEAVASKTAEAAASKASGKTTSARKKTGGRDAQGAADQDAARREEAARDAAVTAGIFETEIHAPTPDPSSSGASRSDSSSTGAERTDKEPAAKKERPAYLRLVK